MPRRARRDEISRRIDKCFGLFIRLLVRERELKAHVEEVPSRECVPRRATVVRLPAGARRVIGEYESASGSAESC
jgi:hypothetical protein